MFLSILLISYRDFGILIDLVVYLTEYLGKIDQSLQTGLQLSRYDDLWSLKILELSGMKHVLKGRYNSYCSILFFYFCIGFVYNYHFVLYFEVIYFTMVKYIVLINDF